MSNHPIKNFLRGVGSIFEIAPPPSRIGEGLERVSVEEAIRRDWERVGMDLRNAMNMEIREADEDVQPERA